MKPTFGTQIAAAAALVVALLAVRPAAGQMDTGPAGRLKIFDAGAILEPKMGAYVPGELRFVDENRREVKLADYFTRNRPVVLNLGYFACPAMCGIVTNAMAEALNRISLTPASDFTVLTVSIDPREKPSLAREKKNSYLEHYQKDGAGEHWHFLTAEDGVARKLAEAVGFGYRWNETTSQFDHDAGVLLLSPDGKITGCLKGGYYDPRDMRLAIVEASEGRVGTVWDKIVLSCMSYDPETRTYSLAVWTIVRIAGGLTVLAIIAMIVFLRRSERRNEARRTVVAPPQPS